MGDVLVRNEILAGDALEQLRRLPDHSVDCVVTSPPYFQLRNYGHTGQLGLEATVDDWITNLRGVLGEVARVLVPTGSLWLNVGDSYSRHPRAGAPPKSLLLGPERLALAMLKDGWVIRNKVVWAKPNPTPASVDDRLTATWEIVFFATRQSDYFFDLDAIRIPHRSANRRRPAGPPKTAARSRPPDWAGPLAGNNSGLSRLKAAGLPGHRLGKNPGDVWTVATSNYRDAHFATFPPRLITPSVLATCPPTVCANCGHPTPRRPKRSGRPDACDCGTETRAGVVLDPFLGAGTTALVAETHGRDWIGIELNPTYITLATKRLADARTAAKAGTST